jgi:hypothetical protein
MPSALDIAIDLVIAQGGDPDRTRTIAIYIADRSSGLSLASAHSSSCSSLRRHRYLLEAMQLTPRQIGGWLALLRGTRTARRGDGRVTGGKPSLIQVLATGTLTDARRARFTQLARRAAGTEQHTRRPPRAGELPRSA